LLRSFHRHGVGRGEHFFHRAFGALGVTEERLTADPDTQPTAGFKVARRRNAQLCRRIIASPTLCLTPPLMSDVADAHSHLRVNRRIVRNTAWVNYLGLCAITMPVGRDRATESTAQP
jgi:Asp-tRNA(Asn)/Glu-tRNA(Gln) amidotransferase A subunit family amidase